MAMARSARAWLGSIQLCRSCRHCSTNAAATEAQHLAAWRARHHRLLDSLTQRLSSLLPHPQVWFFAHL